MKLALFALTLVIPAVASAQNINYTANYQNNTDGSQIVTSPGSGSFTSSITLGVGGPSSSTFQWDNTSPTTFSSGSNVYTYNFDTVLSGGTFSLSNAFQWGDWEITLLGGGNGVLNNNSVSYFWGSNNSYVQGTDFDVYGSGTSSLTLDSLVNSSSGSGGFSGGISITGEYSGLRIAQTYENDNQIGVTDSQARFNLRGYEAVPEPSAALLGLLGAAFFGFRRRR